MQIDMVNLCVIRLRVAMVAHSWATRVSVNFVIWPVITIMLSARTAFRCERDPAERDSSEGDPSET